MRVSLSEPQGETRRVMSAQAAFIIGDALSDRESRSETFNLESPLGTRFWSAVKTGTSKDMRDNWCVGYSELFTAGVWVGNFSGEPMWNVTGVTGAAPVWVELMNRLHRTTGSAAPAPPPEVVARHVAVRPTGQARREWFIAGTETGEIRQAQDAGQARIVYPADGALVALDPDIPPDRQKVFFEAHTGSAPLRWIIDGRSMGAAEELLLWPPTKGKHTAALADEQDRIVDSVAFEVR
jgi:penicillin-binding protein 1C